MRTAAFLLFTITCVAQPQATDTFLGIQFRKPISQFPICEHADDLFRTMTTKTPCRDTGNEADVWVISNQFAYDYPIWAHVRDERIVEIETNFDPDKDTKTFINALTTKYGKPLTVQHSTVSNLVGGRVSAISVLWEANSITAALYSRGRAMDLGYFMVMTREEAIARKRENKAAQNRLNGKF